jgi:GT2 family glycosyltransferase
MISLVMATIGRTAEIRRLVDSLAVQSERRFELIAVDQNGDDRLAPVLAEAAIHGIEVRHLHQDEANLSLARNCGIAAAAYDVVGFPDDDCWYDPACLAEVGRAFADDTELDACIALWEDRDPGCAGLPAHFLHWPTVSRFRSVPISSITLFIKRHSLEQIGGFDTRLGVGRWFGSGEETDLIMRLVRGGYRVRFVPTARVHHAVGGPQQEPPGYWQSLRRRARGTGAIYAKHRIPPPVVLRGLLSPVAKAVLGRAPSLGNGLAMALGRLEGYLGWRDSPPDAGAKR